jgi:hypothetical protein
MSLHINLGSDGEPDRFMTAFSSHSGIPRQFMNGICQCLSREGLVLRSSPRWTVTAPQREELTLSATHKIQECRQKAPEETATNRQYQKPCTNCRIERDRDQILVACAVRDVEIPEVSLAASSYFTRPDSWEKSTLHRLPPNFSSVR